MDTNTLETFYLSFPEKTLWIITKAQNFYHFRTLKKFCLEVISNASPDYSYNSEYEDILEGSIDRFFETFLTEPIEREFDSEVKKRYNLKVPSQIYWEIREKATNKGLTVSDLFVRLFEQYIISKTP